MTKRWTSSIRIIGQSSTNGTQKRRLEMKKFFIVLTAAFAIGSCFLSPASAASDAEKKADQIMNQVIKDDARNQSNNNATTQRMQNQQIRQERIYTPPPPPVYKSTPSYTPTYKYK
jgi:hypothetical protein